MKGKVAIIGASLIERFGELYHKDFDDMVSEAYINSLKTIDNGLDPKEIEHGFLGSAYMRSGVAAGHPCGLLDIPWSRLENACSTGSDAFRAGCHAVASGMYDVVLVIGAEKMNDDPGGLIAMARRPALWSSYGRTMPAFFGMRATRHMHEFGTTKEHLAMVSVKNHYNGSLYPAAMYQFEVSLDQVVQAPMVSWPLGLYDCCPITDGAAAVVLCNSDIAKKYTDDPIYVNASTCNIASWTNNDHESLIGFPATKKAADAAYKMAGIGPKDVDFFECHDCFTITEILNYEDLGFAKKGEGPKLLEEGIVNLDGQKPANPSGGLISKGHPIGATGVAQIVELFDQLKGKAEKIQIPDVEIGLQHNIGLGRGSTGSVSVVSICSRERELKK